MKIRLIAVGKRQPKWVIEGMQDYVKRLPRHLGFRVDEVAPADRGASGSAEESKRQEAQRISQRIEDRERVIALDERGMQISTNQLANALEGWQRDGQNVAILIGGADGLDSDLLKQANERWSLGGLTLPHGMVRLIFCEALYRAWSVTQNHPYHRA